MFGPSSLGDISNNDVFISIKNRYIHVQDNHIHVYYVWHVKLVINNICVLFVITIYSLKHIRLIMHKLLL